MTGISVGGVAITQRYLDKYWDKVVVTPGCWGWNASRNNKGYGVLRVGAGRGKLILIHRLSFLLHYGGEDASVAVVRHRCDNPICSNYLHLEPGTRRDNTNDARLRGRLVVGASHPGAVLNDDSVAEARALWRSGTSATEIANIYGVTRSVMRRAIMGETWKHVPNPVSKKEVIDR